MYKAFYVHFFAYSRSVKEYMAKVIRHFCLKKDNTYESNYISDWSMNQNSFKNTKYYIVLKVQRNYTKKQIQKVYLKKIYSYLFLFDPKWITLRSQCHYTLSVLKCQSYSGVALSVARSSTATEAIVGALRRLKMRAQPRPFTREPNTNPVF